MKIKKDLELHKPFRVIYDGEDFGVYEYDKEMNAYVGVIGNIPMSAMLRAIEDKDYFIKLKEV